MSPSHIHQQGGIMVAVRGSHLLNPQDFVIEQWCSSLKLPAATEKSLIDAPRQPCRPAAQPESR